MASVDIEFDYKKAKDKIQATKAYTDLKSQYDEVKKKAGDSFEKGKDAVSGSVDKLEEQLDVVKEQVKRYQKEVKNQFEQLLDINNVTGGKGSNTIKYVKKMLLKAVKNIEPKINDIIVEESLKAVGCDQQQTYNAGSIYVKVSSVDIGGLLKRDPAVKQNKILYEKENAVIQSTPFSMNRELFNRVSQIGRAHV